MYNGIGLTTARGSGTSGYVQKNLSTINRTHKKHDFPSEQDIQKMEAALNKPPNQELLTHQKKRQIELKCLEERERLEAQGYDEDAIEKRLMDYREELKLKAEEIAKVKELPTPKSELFKSASYSSLPDNNHNRLPELHSRMCSQDCLVKIEKLFRESIGSAILAAASSAQIRMNPPPRPKRKRKRRRRNRNYVDNLNRYSPKRGRRSKSRDRTPPLPDNQPTTTITKCESPVPERSSPNIQSSPKYSIVPSKLRRISSSESPSPPRERRRSRSREKKPKKSRRSSPKRRSTSRDRRSRSRERKVKTHRKSSRSRRQKSRSKSERSKSRSRSRSRHSSRTRSSHSRSRSHDSPLRSRRSRSNSRSRRRKVSPNFRESRRITSARKKPTPYQRSTSSSSSESDDDIPSCYRYRLNGSSSKYLSGKYSSPNSSIESM